MNLVARTKKYTIYSQSCSCHPETCMHYTYQLYKKGILIDQDDYIPSLAIPTNARYKILDELNFSNHKHSKEYRKWNSQKNRK